MGVPLKLMEDPYQFERVPFKVILSYNSFKVYRGSHWVGPISGCLLKRGLLLWGFL